MNEDTNDDYSSSTRSQEAAELRTGRNDLVVTRSNSRICVQLPGRLPCALSALEARLLSKHIYKCVLDIKDNPDPRHTQFEPFIFIGEPS
jgi:hypothetical protein